MGASKAGLNRFRSFPKNDSARTFLAALALTIVALSIICLSFFAGAYGYKLMSSAFSLIK